MRSLPLSIGSLHFVGIGGIGMSGIAEILINLGYDVQGSDLCANANTRRLEDLGARVMIGHHADNIAQAAVVVTSSAVPGDNPEIAAARDHLIPVVRRAEMLAELMRLKWSIAVGGTHGKTTTTSMVAALLEAAGFDPTVINGGIINTYGTNARLGKSDWMVVEADESDGSFFKLPSTIAVVTNIDPEHLDFYGNFGALRDAFQSFVQNIPFYGFATLCIDHPEVQSLISKLSDRRIITYGLSRQAEIRAVNIRTQSAATLFDLMVSNGGNTPKRRIENIRLPIAGDHNVQNALAAITIGLEMEIDDQTIKEGLAAFRGVKRRFSIIGCVNGITIIDDYAHHPVEIAATLKAAKSMQKGKIIAVCQPHRYSRVAALFEEFCLCLNDANTVIISDIYPAGESPLEGIDRDHLIAGLRARGHRAVVPLDDSDCLATLVEDIAEPGDMVVCMGAGDITQWAHHLLKELVSRNKGALSSITGGRR